MAISEVNSKSLGTSIAPLIELKERNFKFKFRKRRVQIKLGIRFQICNIKD